MMGGKRNVALERSVYEGAASFAVVVFKSRLDVEFGRGPRRGFGFCVNANIGGRRRLTLDVNEPLGSPSRLYLIGKRLVFVVGRPIQTWNWRRSCWTPGFSPIAIYPTDHIARFKRAHRPD